MLAPPFVMKKFNKVSWTITFYPIKRLIAFGKAIVHKVGSASCWMPSCHIFQRGEGHNSFGSYRGRVAVLSAGNWGRS